MIETLCSGVLINPVDQKRASDGTPYVTTKIRLKTANDSVIANIICFDADGCRVLLSLDHGAPISVQGQMDIKVVSDKEGNFDVFLYLMADSVMAGPLSPERPGRVRFQTDK